MFHTLDYDGKHGIYVDSVLPNHLIPDFDTAELSRLILKTNLLTNYIVLLF